MQLVKRATLDTRRIACSLPLLFTAKKMRKNICLPLRRSHPRNALLRLTTDFIEVFNAFPALSARRICAMIELCLDARRRAWIAYHTPGDDVRNLPFAVVIDDDCVVSFQKLLDHVPLNRGCILLFALRLLADIHASPFPRLDIRKESQGKEKD